MYAVNNIDIEDLGAFETLKHQNETRVPHILNSLLLLNNNQMYNFVTDAHSFPYAKDIEIPYMINEKKQFLPLKGTRPNFNKRYEIGNPSVKDSIFRYLIKYSNGEVWVSDEDKNYTDSPSGQRISSSEEDLKIVFCEFQAGGGAGNGSNLATYGRGGGAGAYIVVALELEHNEGPYWKKNSFPIVIGKGGQTCNGNNTAGGGDDTGLPWNGGNVQVTAYGGNGANTSNAGACRGYDVHNCPFAYLLYAQNGGTGSGSQTLGPTDTTQSSPQGEANCLHYPQRKATYNGSGQTGGCSVLGNGADGNSSGAGFSAGSNQWGAGGGGAGYKAFNVLDGGNGCGGYLAIYY